MPDQREFNVDALAVYLANHIEGFRGPVMLEKLTGGHSNPTFLLKAASGTYVLRRQPLGELLKGAHAVDREYRVLSALAGTSVPVVEVFHLCEDPAVIGSMFYVMGYAEGRVFWDPALPDVQPEDRRALFFELIRVMAELHNIDIASVGLMDFGRGSGFCARQIALWVKQYREAETECIPEIEVLMSWLQANQPDDELVTLFHGDLKLDNLLFEKNATQAKALLDWELATLGHPFADLSHCCVFLRLPAGAPLTGLAGLDREALGIPSEEELIQYYCQLRGIPGIENWNFYMAFAFFRLAVITQGVYQRAISGNANDPRALQVGRMAQPMAKIAVEMLGLRL